MAPACLDEAVSEANVWRSLERETGIEPATNSLEGCDSTTELLPPSRLAHHRPAASTGQARDRSLLLSYYRSAAKHRVVSRLAWLTLASVIRRERKLVAREGL